MSFESLFSPPLKLFDAEKTIINAPTGFSFTMLIFGFWVPLLRKDWLNFSIYFFFFRLPTFAINLFIFVEFPGFTAVSTIIDVSLSIAFGLGYNQMHIKSLLKKGCMPANDQTTNYLKEKHLDHYVRASFSQEPRN